MNNKNISTVYFAPPFTDFDHMVEHYQRKYGFSREEIKASLKNLKKLGIIKYSTKAKNKPPIKLILSEENKPLFDSYFALNGGKHA